MLAVPVLAGASGYAVCEAGGWAASLQDEPKRARVFYTVIALGMVLGIGLDWSPISPMKALFWSAVINGIVAVPVLIALMLAVSKREVMGNFVAPLPLKIFGWITTVAMAVAAIAMLCVPAS
jgi:Mn2+/Fe2+ NRAMP family transporter